MSWLIFEISIILVEALIDLWFFNRLFAAKATGGRQIAGMMAMVLLYAGLLCCTLFLEINYFIEYLALALICFLYVAFFRKGNLLEKIFWPLLSGAVFGSIAYTVTWGLHSMFGIDYEAFYVSTGFRFVSVMLVHLIYLLFAWLAPQMRSEQLQKTPRSYLIATFFPLFSVALLLLIEYSQVMYTDERWQVLCMIVSGVTLVVNVLVLWLFAHLSRQESAMYRLKEEAALADILTRYHDELGVVYQQMRTWRHDFHHHLQTIQGLLELGSVDKALQYLDKCTEEYHAFERFTATGNLLIDALISIKMSYARSMHIDACAHVVLPEHMPLADTQFCSMLGNLLDNAIEACMRLGEGSERKIVLTIEPSNANLLIELMNTAPMDAALSPAGNLPTTKADASQHGLGLQSVDSIIDQAGGYCSRTLTDGAFQTDVVLPLYAIEAS